MSAWTSDELSRIGRSDELQVTSHRPDGTLRPWVTIWVVNVGNEVYIRSAHGPGNGWFRRAQAAGTGRMKVGGLEKDVAFEVPDQGVHDSIDAAYHAKYDRYGPRIVGTVVGPTVLDVTLRVEPQN
jgi:hypothetical protein